MHQLSFFIHIPNILITCKKKKTTFTFFSCNNWFLMWHELNQEAILRSIITIVRSSGDQLPSCKVPRKLMMPEAESRDKQVFSSGHPCGILACAYIMITKSRLTVCAKMKWHQLSCYYQSQFIQILKSPSFSTLLVAHIFHYQPNSSTVQ